MILEFITYKCRSCEQTFTRSRDEVGDHPLLAQVSFHHCDIENQPTLSGIADAINFVETTE